MIHRNLPYRFLRGQPLKFLNTSNFFIKLTKQLANQQCIGTYMLYPSSEIKVATLALNSVLKARTNVTK